MDGGLSNLFVEMLVSEETISLDWLKNVDYKFFTATWSTYFATCRNADAKVNTFAILHVLIILIDSVPIEKSIRYIHCCDSFKLLERARVEPKARSWSQSRVD